MRCIGLLALALMMGMGSAHALTTKQAMKNPKHAALVIDADTGKVLRSENASAKRYPASLTKMMTLYMTFRALQAGQISMDQMMPVSVKAASQAQTNISLNPGDRISVRNCVLALIVRSANDCSMVLAETLGRSQERFAGMMTNTARQLGMKSTVFKNPNGLPDTGQYTTAYDMARLGIALRRDFPQYYGLFKTTKFVYNGRTYTGHNRVLGRLDGVDGIKTGYIRLSGFNLVSSIKKNGVNLVAVVMGGTSGAERDNYMVSILNDGYQRQYAALQSGRVAENISLADASVQAAAIRNAALSSASLEDRSASKPVNDDATQVASLDDVYTAPAKKKSSKVAAKAPKAAKTWGVQVGAFKDKAGARAALNKASKVVRKGNMNPKVAIASSGKKSKAVHRALLSNLSRQEAMLACQKLQARGNPCMAVQVN